MLGLLLLAVSALTTAATSQAADLKGGRLRVALLADMTNFDPQQFSTVNFPLIKNFYDSLLEYTPDGKAMPSLASSWEIAPDNKSVTVKLRTDVKFHSGAPFNAEAVATTLKKSADPQKGKNVYATMSFVKDWTVVDPQTIRLNFTGPAPERQVTDLL
ncbi:MAG TPA: ABC transporter substrate-binding protein, partial [Thermomicrobiales bacterium]|nr:ABC transporter substrate-binding protein [Thermomicrobiales bacterium]